MKRYQDITTKQVGKKHVYTTSFFPTIKTNEYDIYVITKQGDRLDLLAEKYYKDITKWPVIAQANDLGKGTLVVPPNLQIRIPNLK